MNQAKVDQHPRGAIGEDRREAGHGCEQRLDPAIAESTVDKFRLGGRQELSQRAQPAGVPGGFEGTAEDPARAGTQRVGVHVGHDDVHRRVQRIG